MIFIHTELLTAVKQAQKDDKRYPCHLQWNTIITVHCISKKHHPFYFCDIVVRFHPILLVFGGNIPQEIQTKHIYTHIHGPIHIWFYMFVLYLVKTSFASVRTLRRRPLPVCLVIELESRNFFKRLFKLLTSKPSSCCIIVTSWDEPGDIESYLDN